MKIIIAGGGKVGLALVQQLAAEGHDLTLIDASNAVLQSAVERYDTMTTQGNCASMQVLKSAGAEGADLLIAVTDADEVNLLCCMTAHGMNKHLHTIARIRNPEYAQQVMTMQDVFPLSLTVNPERRAALEIERLLKFPGFLRRDTFAKGRAQIVELRISKDSKLANIPLRDMNSTVKCRVLVCAVLRAGEAVAPSGDFILCEGDRIFVTAPTADLSILLKNLDIATSRVRKVLLCGGGRVSYYLAALLAKDGISVQLLDKNYDRCVELASLLPDTSVIHGDCSSQTTLEAQGITDMDAVVSLTGMDETNMIISLYAMKRGVKQVITNLSRGVTSNIADSLSLGSVICPKDLCSNDIVRYVRAMQNQTGAAISLHTIADGQAEAVEFLIDPAAKGCGVPLKQLKLKKNLLIANITHGADTAIPNGESVFLPGDTVVVVTSGRGVLKQFNDIFAQKTPSDRSLL